MHFHIEDEDSMQIVWEPKEPLDRCLNRAELLQNHHRPPLARAGFSATGWLLSLDRFAGVNFFRSHNSGHFVGEDGLPLMGGQSPKSSCTPPTR